MERITFANGEILIEKKYRTSTQYEWFVDVKLTDSQDGTRRHIRLNRTIFLTKAFAIDMTKKLLAKYKLL